jgi:hypothetical protein
MKSNCLAVVVAPGETPRGWSLEFFSVISQGGERIRMMSDIQPPTGGKDFLLPTAECARCHGLNFCSLEGDQSTVVCGDYRGILTLRYAEEVSD